MRGLTEQLAAAVLGLFAGFGEGPEAAVGDLAVASGSGLVLGSALVRLFPVHLGPAAAVVAASALEADLVVEVAVAPVAPDEPAPGLVGLAETVPAPVPVVALEPEPVLVPAQRELLVVDLKLPAGLAAA